jgi:hypothetical protein
MLAQILAIVERILAGLGTLTSLANLINGNTAKAAQENVPFSIDTNVSIIQAVVTDGTFGNAALLTAINGVLSDLSADVATIITDISNLTNGTTPVSLPVTPPAGYGGGSGADAAEIWAYPSGSTGATANDRLDNTSQMAVNLSTMESTFPIAGNPYYGVRGVWWNTYGVNGPSADPKFDTRHILPLDELGDFLERESGYTGWSRTSDGFYYINQDGLGSPFDYVCLVSPAQFSILQSAQVEEILNQLPPVWPGETFVAMLSTYTIEPQMTIDEYCHGILIDISAVTVNKPSVPYDSALAYKFIGAVAFINENGYVEPFQALSFTKAIYCPRQLASANGLVVRADPSVVGTIKTWKLAI